MKPLRHARISNLRERIWRRLGEVGDIDSRICGDNSLSSILWSKLCSLRGRLAARLRLRLWDRDFDFEEPQ